MFCGAPQEFAPCIEYQLQNPSSPLSLYSCKVCCAIQARPAGDTLVSPQGQASFHERLFINAGDSQQAILENSHNFRPVISEHLAPWIPRPSADILACEIGCGSGNILRALKDEGYSVIGCEYSNALVDYGKRNYHLDNNEFIQANAWDMPKLLKRNSMAPSLLFLWHSLEHIKDSMELLKLMLPACSPALVIAFQTPLPMPEHISSSHLFFPVSQTYFFMAGLLDMTVTHICIEPYNRYLTCTMSSDGVPSIVKPEVCRLASSASGAIGGLLGMLDDGLKTLSLITKEQYVKLSDASDNPQ